MLQYFLYNTNFGNTIVNSSGTTFSPVPPYAELYFDYSMPEIQPLYLYAVSGGSIIINSQENIDNYLGSIEVPPTPNDNVTYSEFTGITETLKYTSITGVTNLGVGNGSLYASVSGNKINLKTLSGGTNVTLTCNGNYVTINATGGGGTTWGSISGTISNQTDLNNCLNARLTTASFTIYSGTTVPNTYYNKTQINGYTGKTQTILDAKAFLSGATFTGIVNVPKPAKNDNTTCAATTSWYISQGGTTIPLVNSGTGSVGTSNLFSREDHVHPISSSIVSLNTINSGTITTTSATDTLMTGMQLLNVPAGTYLLNFGTSLQHSTTTSTINTTIYVANTLVPDSTMLWQRGGGQGAITTTHNYSGFPITLAAISTVEIRWRTSAVTASSIGSRYISLLKIG